MMQQNPFGKNLYLDRYSLGLAQSDISRAINVSQQAIARWESGRSVPRYAVLDKLKNFLEEEFKKINDKSIVCSMKNDFIPTQKKQNSKIELRDYFAARAMQGIVASCIDKGFNDDLVAAASYRLSDAMIKAREA